MATIHPDRMTVEPEAGFVVFIIGMRINTWYRIDKWWRVIRAFRAMFTELTAEPERGLLHARILTGINGVTSVQYWESTDKLLRYAHDRLHTAAWQQYYRLLDDGTVGIWHETYQVGAERDTSAQGYEAIYKQMPAFGLGAALGVRPLTRQTRRSSDRLGTPRSTTERSRAEQVPG
ncbi:DUF4188 domain-containing protein [Salinactinospora qingdaonensis]|uniref:DUF4188 domain-containing protein n=1 Tax=Salinactinospora qingdaonensis TaxID=702744 RepID=A0ABP7FV82_9ACTN